MQHDGNVSIPAAQTETQASKASSSLATQGIDRSCRYRYLEVVFVPYTGAKAQELTTQIQLYTGLVERLRAQPTDELRLEVQQCHARLMELRKAIMLEMFGSVEQDDHAA